LNSTFNYVRNSVKVVINAYTGKMDFVVVDPSDPIIEVYERAFPDLFMSTSQVEKAIPGIQNHFRYPEDIFTVQTNMYGRYHLTNASDFFTQAQAWTVPPDPGSGPLSSAGAPVESLGPNNTVVSSVQQMPPQYMLAHLPGSTQQSFLEFEPFVPIGSSTARQNLTAWMAASLDNSQSYGTPTLRIYESPPGQTVDGPALVTNLIRTDPAITSQFTLLNQQGSTVEVGEVAAVPIDDTLLYVEPIYVESSNGSKPFSQYCTTPAALNTPLITGGTQPNSQGNGTSGSTPTTTAPKSTSTSVTPPTTLPASTPASGSTSVASLLNQAKALTTQATAALKAGNSAQAEAYLNQANSDVARAQQLIGQS
jgi:uncharacterized protein